MNQQTDYNKKGFVDTKLTHFEGVNILFVFIYEYLYFVIY